MFKNINQACSSFLVSREASSQGPGTWWDSLFQNCSVFFRWWHFSQETDLGRSLSIIKAKGDTRLYCPVSLLCTDFPVWLISGAIIMCSGYPHYDVKVLSSGTRREADEFFSCWIFALHSSVERSHVMRQAHVGDTLTLHVMFMLHSSPGFTLSSLITSIVSWDANKSSVYIHICIYTYI